MRRAGCPHPSDKTKLVIRGGDDGIPSYISKTVGNGLTARNLIRRDMLQNENFAACPSCFN